MGNEVHRSSGIKHTRIHSLILKIWLKNGDGYGLQPQWQGRITHVPSGEQVYTNDPNELLTQVAAHMRKLGVPLTICWHFRIWLQERKHRSRRELS